MPSIATSATVTPTIPVPSSANAGNTPTARITHPIANTRPRPMRSDHAPANGMTAALTTAATGTGTGTRVWARVGGRREPREAHHEPDDDEDDARQERDPPAVRGERRVVHQRPEERERAGPERETAPEADLRGGAVEAPPARRGVLDGHEDRP